MLRSRLKPKEKYGGRRMSGGMKALLVAGGIVVAAVAGVGWYKWSRHAPAAPVAPKVAVHESEPTEGPLVEPSHGASRVAQPFIPGMASPKPAETTPIPPHVDPPAPVDVAPEPEVKPAPPKPEPPPRPAKPVVAFIGDAQYKRYHRPDCRYVAEIAPDKRVNFATAAEAFDQGYIPCKVCSPEVPVEVPEPPTTPVKPPKPSEPEPPPDVAPDEPTAVSTRLVGDLAKHRYHRADCKYAKLIKGENLVAFKSPAEALDRDFYPCRTCNPDLPAVAMDLPKPEQPVKAGVPVKLTDKDKRAMYKSLSALKQMLKGISSPTRPYEVLSDRYHVPVSVVEAVEAEGSAARWPRE